MKNICLWLSILAFLCASVFLGVAQPYAILPNYSEWVGQWPLLIFTLSVFFGIGVYCLACVFASMVGHEEPDRIRVLIAVSGAFGVLAGLYIFIDTSGGLVSLTQSIVYMVVGLAVILIAFKYRTNP